MEEQRSAVITPLKQEALDWLDSHACLGEEVATYIWHHPELGLGEHFSSAILQDLMTKGGFEVRSGVAEMSTAFVAQWGQGKPVIGINGEFDALPGLSQEGGLNEERAITEGAPGHGCGHNLFCTYSAMAALALKNVMERHHIPGTIRLYGTPAEETLMGKAFMVKAGLYKDCDAMLSWHPGCHNGVTYGRPGLAMESFKIRFYGRASHAAGSPWNGRSALDAVELMNVGCNYMREHIRPELRVHYTVSDGGKAPNVVPPFAEVWYFVRAPRYSQVTETVEWVRQIAQGAAMMTQTRMEFLKISGVWPVLSNRILTRVAFRNIQALGGAVHGEEDQKSAEPFARDFDPQIQDPYIDTAVTEFVDAPFQWGTEGGSTDDGNVSWSVPMALMETATQAKGTPNHTWQAVAQNCLTGAFNGGLKMAGYLASTALDLFSDPGIIQEAKAEFDQFQHDLGPFVDPVADTPTPSFKLMHGVDEDWVPKQWEDRPYPYPDIAALLK